jgi:hypothetical protein
MLSVVGNQDFMSINSHLGKIKTAIDDLISLGYIFVYLHKRKLPWQSLLGLEDIKESKMEKGVNFNSLPPI